MADEPASTEKQFVLRKIYLKDVSFESPKAPDIFTSDVNAQTLLNIRSGNRQIDGGDVEVTLTVTVRSVAQDDTIFLVEVVQAGVFGVEGYTPEERLTLLGTLFPGMLYPYAREAVTTLAMKGGFPQLLLQPLDFNVLFAQNMGAREPQLPPAEPARTAAEPASRTWQTD
jgi:preprotein translocase subunit SecB